MQKAFEKIIEKVKAYYDAVNPYVGNTVKKIVNQVAEEYKRTAHYGCNDNGEHEKCDGCGIADKCPDYKKYLFENISTEHVNCSSDSLIEEVCEYEGAIECEPMSGCYGYYVPNCNKEVVISICDTFSFKFCPYCGKKIKVIEYKGE